jgi:hypothetical protein
LVSYEPSVILADFSQFLWLPDVAYLSSLQPDIPGVQPYVAAPVNMVRRWLASLRLVSYTCTIINLLLNH